ncbi:MAG TPA: efflux RND transporter permease subunit [Oligoflexus sp.]|uniref:efflux RND transporter permease subunit n=1 Tax=Oligoflexus sp. TaxID=1971216 RepID=UPI002D7F5DBD|nr:efflux RND transporter permease subunit [Oligoflexus sp.]HET9236648.1 efflux RND transporter permease subunit [Oligoflexus sp.]
MWISNFAIKNPVVTIVTTLALVVFGAIALFILDTDEFPEVNPPVISIAVPYPGAAPETVEREVVDRMEEAFAAISGVDEIQSTSMDSFGIITVTFDFEKDLQQASQDIRDKISEIRQDLPPEMEEPTLTRFDPQDLPVVSLTLTSAQYSEAELTRIADPGIVSQLRSLNGVADVTVVGGVERELTVELQPQALQAAGVSVAQVVQTLQAQNVAAPVGRLTGSYNERAIRLSGRLQGPEDFKQVAIATVNGKAIRLGDVAQVSDGSEEQRTLALYNGQRAVGIDIKKSTNSSTTAVSNRIREDIKRIQEGLPQGVNLQIVRDSGVRVELSVEDVEASLVEGALLTVLVVFIFLASWRSTVITGLALPVSVLASFIAVWAFGFTLNSMSLLGLSLAIGILIDDAIVVRENIVRHMEMGKDHVTAAREGTSEIGMAVAATTFSIVVVFVPIAFMGGVAEQWFAPFALTIASSVMVSLFVSFSLDPMLSAVWSDPEVEGGKKTWVSRKLDIFNAWFDRQTERYKRIIAWALRHKLIMFLFALGSFVGALMMPAVGLVGSGFFPLQDRSEFSIRLESPPGSNLDYTRLKVEEAARMAREYPEVAYTYATVGGRGEAVDEASIYVRLVPKADRNRSQHVISDDMRSRIQRIGGVTASLTTGGFGSQKQIEVEIRGAELPVLQGIADELQKAVEKIPGAVDVGLSTKGQKPELDVRVDRELAGSLGLTVGQLAQALRPAFAGIDAGDWVDPTGETRDVMVRFAPEFRARPSDLEGMPVMVSSQEGQQLIPLGQVAHIQLSEGPAQINHLDRRRVITVGANTDGRPLSEVVPSIQEKVKSMHLPPGYTITQGGEAESQSEVFGRILLALGIAVMLMYLILVMQFGSFLDPIAIMASLPLSLIGVMLGLLLTGSTLNLMSMIGVILLMGIVAKNAILLIDFAKWAEEDGKDRKTAIVEAGGTRLRPIIMTSLAIVVGMLPVAIGSGEGADFRAPLGRAVIGGVVTSTILTLLVIPTFYETLADWRDAAFQRMFKRSARIHGAGGHSAAK